MEELDHEDLCSHRQPRKLKELRRILEAQGHQVLSQKELGLDLDPEETGTTFAENAAIKAAAFARASGLPTIAR